MILDKEAVINEYTANGWWSTDTLIDLFQRNVAHTPDELAVVDPPNRDTLVGGNPLRLTYRELQEYVDRLANALLSAGVGKDDVVMVQLPNIAELVISYLAVARIGAIISPVAVQYRTHELRYIMGIVEPKLFITVSHFNDFNYLEMVQELQVEFASLQTIIALGEQLPDDVASLEIILNTSIDSEVLDTYLKNTTWTANDIFTVCWTSGTEADPKGVPRSHNHWTAIAYFTTDGCEMEPGHNLLNPFPMINMSAIGGMLVPWLQTGGKLVMHHPLNLPLFLKQIVTEKINYTVAPPVLLNLLLLKPALLENVDLSSIKNIGSGSAPLSPWMVSQWDERFGISVLNMFGSNEGVALVSSPPDVPNPAERASFFPRFGAPGYEWAIPMTAGLSTKLVDPDTGEEIVERGIPGELAIKGPTVFPGYFKRPDLTEEAFDDEGYFYTGDLFQIDGVDLALDRYHFVGRLKDIIIRGGMKMSPMEVEVLLEQHPAVAEVAVVGCPDRRIKDEIAVAVVALKPDSQFPKEEMVEFLKSKDIAHYKLPKRLRIVDALPRNPLGKVLKRVLRDQVCDTHEVIDEMERHEQHGHDPAM